LQYLNLIMKKYKIYCLKNPINNDIRYIGQTSLSLNRRLYLHLYHIDYKSYKNSWLKNLIKNGINPVIELIETLNDQISCNEREIFWIDKLRKEGKKLTNQTIGGNVTTGYKFTEEQKQKIKGRKPWNKDKCVWGPRSNYLWNTKIKFH